MNYLKQIHAFVLNLAKPNLLNSLILVTLPFYPTHVKAQAQQDTTQAGKVNWRFQNPASGLNEKGQFKNGKRSGLWEFYKTNGKLAKREKYKKGQFWWAIYYKENGKVAYSIDRKGKVVKRSDCGC
ncbi:MAG: hypothetical protein EXR21_08360 [Flavobacteriaceae bacterium]|nr:hypothetical protein [Flavobacteriaceae bacterium]